MVFFKTPTADIKKPEGYFILCLFVYLVFTLSECYVMLRYVTFPCYISLFFLALNREQLLLPKNRECVLTSTVEKATTNKQRNKQNKTTFIMKQTLICSSHMMDLAVFSKFVNFF